MSARQVGFRSGAQKRSSGLSINLGICRCWCCLIMRHHRLSWVSTDGATLKSQDWALSNANSWRPYWGRSKLIRQKSVRNNCQRTWRKPRDVLACRQKKEVLQEKGNGRLGQMLLKGWGSVSMGCVHLIWSHSGDLDRRNISDLYI